MPRIRTIKPEFFTDPDLIACSAYARLAFIGLWTQADREGRLKDEPRRLKLVLFPGDDLDVGTLLDELEAARFIVRYEADGQRYLQIRTFCQHQQPHIRESASTIPAPGQHSARMVLAPDEPVGREGSYVRIGEGVRKGPAGGTPLGDRRRHTAHACCGRVCLPGFLFTEFVSAYGGDEDTARRYVEAFFRAHDPPDDGQPIGDDPVRFWRATWAAHHPSRAPTGRQIRQAQQGQAGEAAVAAFMAAGDET